MTDPSPNPSPNPPPPRSSSPTFPLSGRTALITGAGSGIGRSLAFAFARAGCYVACVSRAYPLGPVGSGPDSYSSSQTIAELINASTSDLDPFSPDRARDFICDVTNPASFVQLEKDIRKWVDQPVTVLVNNAGVARVEAIEFQRPYLPVEESEGTYFSKQLEGMESWNKVIATNLTGPVALTYQFLPGMLAVGEGCIISVGSRNAVMPVPFMAAYNVSKTGLLKFHETLEKEVGGRRVTNFFVVPGNIDTNILKREDSIDGKSYQESEEVRGMVDRIKQAGTRSGDPENKAQKFADVCVKLAAMGEEAVVLSGRYVDAEREVEPLLDEARKGAESDILEKSLYRLKIDRLQP
ncbi:hypothetical protein B0T20DRAFT_343434 [Sordaria brevicollis]|uniref:NAD(P)-binding protein n=1 Tax=Sordaria brevicollis TaxID=83679 RepID=A0AAE0PMJ7_SORBR|nr:hypothetical protein B0T20DRAFT_343434 [Sordaria brevicollis]